VFRFWYRILWSAATRAWAKQQRGNVAATSSLFSPKVKTYEFLGIRTQSSWCDNTRHAPALYPILCQTKSNHYEYTKFPANYADRPATSFRQSQCQLLRVEGDQRNGSLWPLNPVS
jgi:hypothetical protein